MADKIVLNLRKQRYYYWNENYLLVMVLLKQENPTLLRLKGNKIQKAFTHGPKETHGGKYNCSEKIQH